MTGAPLEPSRRIAARARCRRGVLRWVLATCLGWALVLLASRPVAADPALSCDLGEPEPPAEAAAGDSSAAASPAGAGQQQLTALSDERLCDSDLVFPEDGLTAVPFCLEEEASAVAPPPLREAEDSRLAEPVRSRSELPRRPLLERSGSGSDDQPSDQPSDSPDKAMLPTSPGQAAAAVLLELDLRCRPEAGPEGYNARIYRPPRGR